MAYKTIKNHFAFYKLRLICSHHPRHPALVTHFFPSFAGWLYPSGSGPPAGPWPGGLPAIGERYKGQGAPACPAHCRTQGWHQGRGPAPAERPQRRRRVQGEQKRWCSPSLVVNDQLVSFFLPIWLFVFNTDFFGFLDCLFFPAAFSLYCLNLLLMLFLSEKKQKYIPVCFLASFISEKIWVWEYPSHS